MKAHVYDGHRGLRRLDSTFAVLADSLLDAAYAVITAGDLSLTVTETAIATALTAKTLLKSQKRAIEAWYTLRQISVTKGSGGTASAFRRSVYDGTRGLKRLDSSIDGLLTNAEIEAAYGAVDLNISYTLSRTAIATAVSPTILSTPQKYAVIAWWLLNNLNT